MQPYVTMSMRANYTVEFVEPTTPWRFKPKELAKLVQSVNIFIYCFICTLKTILPDYDDLIIYTIEIHIYIYIHIPINNIMKIIHLMKGIWKEVN